MPAWPSSSFGCGHRLPAAFSPRTGPQRTREGTPAACSSAAALLDSLFEQPNWSLRKRPPTSFSVRHNHQRTPEGTPPVVTRLRPRRLACLNRLLRVGSLRLCWIVCLSSLFVLYSFEKGGLRRLHCAFSPGPYFLFMGSLADPPLRASNENVSIIMLPPSLLVSPSRGTAPVLVPLRPSSEALLRARAPGAGE